MEQMTTDIAVLERALVVMAVCMAAQTLLFLGAGVGAFVAWRRAGEAMAEAKAIANAQLAELREQLQRMSATVDDAGRAFGRSSAAVDGVITDVRDAMGTVSHSVGTVASAVTAPRAAIAIGLLRGIQMWRRRRAARPVVAEVVGRHKPRASAGTVKTRHSKGDGNGTVEQSGLGQ